MLIITTLKLKSEIYFLTSIFSLPSGLHTPWGFWWLLSCWHWSFLSLREKRSSLEISLLGKNITLFTLGFLFFLLIWVMLVIKQSCAGLTVIYTSIHTFMHLNIYLVIHGTFWGLPCSRHRARCLDDTMTTADATFTFMDFRFIRFH